MKTSYLLFIINSLLKIKFVIKGIYESINTIYKMFMNGK